MAYVAGPGITVIITRVMMTLMRRQEKIQPRLSEQIWQQVEALIREEWSPEQIVGRVAMEQGVSISHEWVYQYIYADQRSGGDLYRFLLVRRSGASAMGLMIGVGAYHYL